jgi:CDP-diacylglycerol--glycerol-3-phosphate 3-phosphatidyltransferase
MPIATITEPETRPALLNLPNQLTAARLVLAVVFFVLVAFEVPLVALGVFIVAAVTDAVDGYLARRYGQVTSLGRVLDPLVDKVIVLGAFIFLLPLQPGSGLTAWMVTVIVARELLVTGLRAVLERRGVDFSATWSGKLKMVVQCMAIGWILLYLGVFDQSPQAYWAGWVRDVLIWLAVAVTVWSGLVYLGRVVRVYRIK